MSVRKFLSASLEIERSKIRRMAPLKVVLPVPAAVDLGLPSGLKWASFNVGANKPEDYGDYFAWGETEPKNNYNWATYKWCTGSYNRLTKYNSMGMYGTVDNKATLDPEDDAAHVNWGGRWRMPTNDDYRELFDNCDAVWTTENGVNGRRFISRKVGYTDKSIFVPATGYHSDSSLKYVGSYCYCWTSSRYMDLPYRSRFLYTNAHSMLVNDNYRYYGYSIRPVCE